MFLRVAYFIFFIVQVPFSSCLAILNLKYLPNSFHQLQNWNTFRSDVFIDEDYIKVYSEFLEALQQCFTLQAVQNPIERKTSLSCPDPYGYINFSCNWLFIHIRVWTMAYFLIPWWACTFCFCILPIDNHLLLRCKERSHVPLHLTLLRVELFEPILNHQSESSIER